jgi:hypothetical protein
MIIFSKITSWPDNGLNQKNVYMLLCTISCTCISDTAELMHILLLLGQCGRANSLIVLIKCD